MRDNMKMYVFDCGSMSALRHLIIQDDIALADQELRIELPVQSFLIDHPEAGLILFDTACDPEGQDGNWTEARSAGTQYVVKDNMYLPQRIEAAGYKLEDIKTVIISHLHVDHAGCLKYFPHAKVYVNEDELAQTMKAYRENGNLGGSELSDIEAIVKTNINFTTIPRETQELKLADGVTILNFGPGHAYGMLGALVELPKHGNYMLIADALYLQKNMGPPRILPPDLPGLCYDRKEYLRTVDELEAYSKAHNATIIFGHDIDQYRELIKEADPWLD